MDARMHDVSVETEIEAYVSQYRGHSRFTRLLKIAESSNDIVVVISALKVANKLAKKENLLG
jgi:hypothetical protein